MAARNPWLDIPESDYVGHMSSPEVDQYRVLNRLLREVLIAVRPAAILVPVCSTGNGLEHVDPAVTSRVVAVDHQSTDPERLTADAALYGLGLDSRFIEPLGSGKSLSLVPFPLQAAATCETQLLRPAAT